MGYRQSSEFINIKYNLTVSKEQVRKCLKVVDPEGVNERWRKVKKRRIYETNRAGDVFHMDGNDKLKRWWFPHRSNLSFPSMRNTSPGPSVS